MNEKPTLISPKEVVRMMFQKMLGKVFIFNGVINVFTTLFPLSHIVIHRKTDLKDKTIFNLKPSPPLPFPLPVILSLPFLVWLNTSWILVQVPHVLYVSSWRSSTLVPFSNILNDIRQENSQFTWNSQLLFYFKKLFKVMVEMTFKTLLSPFHYFSMRIKGQLWGVWLLFQYFL